MKVILSIILALGVSNLCHAEILVNDSFDGHAIDESAWETMLPFDGSLVGISSGLVTLTDRGTLFTRDHFAGPLQISGSFTLNSALEHFKIAVRSDATIPSGNSFAERTGIVFAFSNDGDQISIQQFSSDGSGAMLALESYALQSGVSYDFTIRLVDDWLSLAINGFDEISASSDYATGGRIGFFSREGFGSSTSLDFIEISSIPEPSTWGVLGGIVCFGIAVMNRRRKQLDKR